jgi:hypothetical protein
MLFLILHSLFIFPDICYTLLFTIRQEISELQSLPPTASYRYFTKEQKMCLGTFLRLRRSLATSTLYAAVRILAERFLLYRKAISCKVKKSLDIIKAFFMQEMGLEPTRYCYHRHLKPARLPIPPLLRTNDILPFQR